MTIKVHAGDFIKGSTTDISLWGNLALKTEEHPFFGEDIPLKNLETVEIATEESTKKIGGTIGWGVTGGVLLGPVGLLAGLLLGGKKTEVTFVAKFKDGRKFMGTTNPKTYKLLAAAAF